MYILPELSRLLLLPDKIIKRILHYIQVKDMLNCRLVSYNLKTFIDTQVGLYFNAFFTNEWSYDKICFFKRITLFALVIGDIMDLAFDCTKLFTKQRFCHLKILRIVGPISLELLKQVIDNCPSDVLEHLELFPCTFELFSEKNILPENPSEHGKEFRALKTLAIGFNQQGFVGTDASHPAEVKDIGGQNCIAFLPYIDAKNLRSFSITFYPCPIRGAPEAISNFWDTFINYVQKRYKTIKELKIYFLPIANVPTHSNLGVVSPEKYKKWTPHAEYKKVLTDCVNNPENRIKDPSVIATMRKKVSILGNILQLENFATFFIDEDLFLLTPFVNGLHSLKCLQVNVEYNCSWKLLDRVVCSNCQFLQTIIIHAEFKRPLDCSMFHVCPNLKELALLNENFLRSAKPSCANTVPQPLLIQVGQLHRICPKIERFCNSGVPMKFLDYMKLTKMKNLKDLCLLHPLYWATDAEFDMFMQLLLTNARKLDCLLIAYFIPFLVKNTKKFQAIQKILHKDEPYAQAETNGGICFLPHESHEFQPRWTVSFLSGSLIAYKMPL